MKNVAIAARVFEIMDQVPLRAMDGGAFAISIGDLAGLSLVPWFCDPSVQWAVRLGVPDGPLRKSPLKATKGAFVTITEVGALLAGVPGDGMAPATHVLRPLAEALAQVVQPGMKLELASANLGVVKRDRQVMAETSTTFGNQRYVGKVEGDGMWNITDCTVGLANSTFGIALDCGRRVVGNGPWKVRDKAEAYSVLMHWLESPEANVNPLAVKRFIHLQDDELVNSDPGMVRLLHGLGLGFFRHRLANGPFRWPAPGPVMHSRQQLEEVARDVVG